MSNRSLNNGASAVIWVSPSEEAVVEISDGYFHVNQHYVHLTSMELCLLKFIISGGGKVRTKPMILSELYSTQSQPEQKIIDIFVCKIRKKLAHKHAEAASMIKTVWGRGYALATPSEETNRRWGASVKASILESISLGYKSVEAILIDYPQLSADELSEWQILWKRYRRAGLRVTRTQHYAQSPA